MERRTRALYEWAGQRLASRNIEFGDRLCLKPVSDDASFRKYYRYADTRHSFIFVDAPPDKEDSRPFVAVSSALVSAGINAPVVHDSDLDAGFMMVSDLGDDLYLPFLRNGDPGVDALYDDALSTLLDMQLVDAGVPEYDDTLLQSEMMLFPDWFLARNLGITFSAAESAMFRDLCDSLLDNANDQPRVFVHRDYHSRNLLVVEGHRPGVIDFQDAVRGPVTYDLVSLLKDCYHRLSPAHVDRFVGDFRSRLVEEGRMPPVGEEKFRRWFDLMGMQRHLKCAGIFSRLSIRDGKHGYLDDIPLVLGYLSETAASYPEFAGFGDWLEDTVLPRMGGEVFRR